MSLKESFSNAFVIANRNRITFTAGLMIASSLAFPRSNEGYNQDLSQNGTIPPTPIESKWFLPSIQNLAQFDIYKPKPVTIRVGTFNGHIENNLPVEPEVRKMKDEEGVDLFSFQEITRDEIEQLESNLNLECETGNGNVSICDDKDNTSASFSGPAIISPITNPNGSRDMVCSKISSQDSEFIYCGVHVWHEGQNGQLGQIENNANYAASSSNNDEDQPILPVIVAGDFNTPSRELSDALNLNPEHIACDETNGKICPGDIDKRGDVDNVAVVTHDENVELTEGKRGQNTDTSDHTSVVTSVNLTP